MSFRSFPFLRQTRRFLLSSRNVLRFRSFLNQSLPMTKASPYRLFSSTLAVAPIVALSLQNNEELEHQNEEVANTPLEDMPDVSNDDWSLHPAGDQPHVAAPESNVSSMMNVSVASTPSPVPVKTSDACASIVPHPEKAHKGGEDACFISENRRVLVVADGVGGWAELQVDPALFSKGLCAAVGEHSREAVDQDNDESVRAVVQRAYDDICDRGIEGSSTLCTAFCYPDHVIVCNLGDSGLRIIRGNELAYRSQEQTHQFNFPYQLGSRGRGEAEHPQDATIDRVQTQPGDVIVMGSDGLFDNVFDEHIIALVRDNISKPAEEIARIISSAASAIASDPSSDTPFARAAADHALTWFGGKLDDITVVVAKL